MTAGERAGERGRTRAQAVAAERAALPAAVAPAAEGVTEHAGERSQVWLDAGRIVAVVAVVMLHSVAPLTWNFGDAPTWWVGNVYNSAGRWCVPLFVMVSGALLLDPAKRIGVGSFYRRRLVRVGLPLAAWTGVYFAWSMLRSPTPPSAWGDALGIAAGRPYYHLWFLYMLIGLYVVTPILRRFTATASRRELRITVGVLLALGIADAFVQVVLHVGQPNALTLFVPYVGYFLAGYLIRRFETPRPADAPLLALIFGLAVAITALGAYLCYRFGNPSAGDFMIDYLSPTTVVSAAAMFMLMAALLPNGWSARHSSVARLITFGGVASFGVYLVHPMILELLPGLTGFSVHSGLPAAAVPAMVAIVVAISTAVIFVLRQLPGIRALV